VDRGLAGVGSVPSSVFAAVAQELQFGLEARLLSLAQLALIGGCLLPRRCSALQVAQPDRSCRITGKEGRPYVPSS
jgi:hypothetical protein